jgi:tetratricopeptide (TPR) repeat protein
VSTPVRLALACLTLTLGACGQRPTADVAQSTAPAAPMPMQNGHEMATVPATMAAWAEGAQLFGDVGSAHRPVTTKSEEVQRYFDQGIRLMWAFNHDEATRSFAKAAALDPDCAACYWGVSLTVGPNYNLPFLAAPRAKVAFEALHLAQQHIASASPVEKALIEALVRRYPSDAPLDAGAALPVQTAYSEAMHAVAGRFPDDLDVQTLYAESLMNLHAWKLWGADGKPAPGTQEVVAILESVLARDPAHAGANHYYVHALEASPNPGKAVASAERLRTLAPAAGHLVHMPAHIFQRIGRYADSAAANEHAAAADEAYVHQTRPPDYYPVMYTAHNYQFLAYATAMQGRSRDTIAAVDASRRVVSDAMLLEMPGADWYVAELYSARVRFGRWDELLAMPRPDARLPGLMVAYLYARGMATAATGRVADAKQALDELKSMETSVPADAGAGQNLLRDLIAVAIPCVEARIARAQSQRDVEIAALRRGVAAEDRISYDEPKNWFFPVRHALGAALLEAGDAAGAERVFLEDLRQSPDNGWALRGLAAALKAQHKPADSVERQLATAWKQADVTPATSVF